MGLERWEEPQLRLAMTLQVLLQVVEDEEGVEQRQ